MKGRAGSGGACVRGNLEGNVISDFERDRRAFQRVAGESLSEVRGQQIYFLTFR